MQVFKETIELLIGTVNAENMKRKGKKLTLNPHWLKKRRRDRIKYIQLYIAKLKGDKEQQLLLEELEKRLPAPDIQL